MGCHCEKGKPPTLAAHAHGALPLVRAAWGVTARKSSHNASNARGVAAGKMGRNSSSTNYSGNNCSQNHKGMSLCETSSNII